MDIFESIFVKTCPSSLGWGCIMWPILFPAILAIISVILFWLFAKTSSKPDKNNKDYSLIFIIGSIVFIAAIGFIVYWTNKIPQ